ncbi:unnamed protein product [Amoebophrya sp. A120]|nr:unnamed protein product [Amoebophrya sp. A120]|eukprot:GSA120T00011314001.1
MAIKVHRGACSCRVQAISAVLQVLVFFACHRLGCALGFTVGSRSRSPTSSDIVWAAPPSSSQSGGTEELTQHRTSDIRRRNTFDSAHRQSQSFSARFHEVRDQRKREQSATEKRRTANRHLEENLESLISFLTLDQRQDGSGGNQPAADSSSGGSGQFIADGVESGVASQLHASASGDPSSSSSMPPSSSTGVVVYVPPSSKVPPDTRCRPGEIATTPEEIELMVDDRHPEQQQQQQLAQLQQSEAPARASHGAATSATGSLSPSTTPAQRSTRLSSKEAVLPCLRSRLGSHGSASVTSGSRSPCTTPGNSSSCNRNQVRVGPPPGTPARRMTVAGVVSESGTGPISNAQQAEQAGAAPDYTADNYTAHGQSQSLAALWAASKAAAAGAGRRKTLGSAVGEPTASAFSRKTGTGAQSMISRSTSLGGTSQSSNSRSPSAFFAYPSTPQQRSRRIESAGSEINSFQPSATTAPQSNRNAGSTATVPASLNGKFYGQPVDSRTGMLSQELNEDEQIVAENYLPAHLRRESVTFFGDQNEPTQRFAARSDDSSRPVLRATASNTPAVTEDEVGRDLRDADVEQKNENTPLSPGTRTSGIHVNPAEQELHMSAVSGPRPHQLLFSSQNNDETHGGSTTTVLAAARGETKSKAIAGTTRRASRKSSRPMVARRSSAVLTSTSTASTSTPMSPHVASSSSVPDESTRAASAATGGTNPNHDASSTGARVANARPSLETDSDKKARDEARKQRIAEIMRGRRLERARTGGLNLQNVRRNGDDSSAPGQIVTARV